MTTSEGAVLFALQEEKCYDVFHWVSPSETFVAANHIAEHFMIHLHSIEGWDTVCELKGKECRVVGDDDDDHNVDNADERKTDLATAAGHSQSSTSSQVTPCVDVKSFFVTLQMYHMDAPITPLLQSSHTRGTEHELDEWIVFPIAVRDVPLDAAVHCCIYSSQCLEGTAVFHPFSACGELEVGPRRYFIRTNTTASTRADDVERSLHEAQQWELLARDFREGLVPQVPWMDKLLERRLGKLQEGVNATTTGSSKGVPVLHLDFPPTSSGSRVFLLSAPNEWFAPSAANPSQHALFRAIKTTPQRFAPFFATPTQPYLDLCKRDENLCEAKASVLSKFLFILTNSSAQPGPQERRQLKEIAQKPLIQLDGLKLDDEMLLWQFRSFLSRDPVYFVPFMRSVNWNNKGERHEALRVMQQWKPISFAQALVCLSFYFREVADVRNYAINVLERQSDERLQCFLLQLVQGVRYDVAGELENFLTQRATRSWELCSTLFWYVVVEASLDTGQTNSERSRAGNGQQRYVCFLQRLKSTLEEAKVPFLKQLDQQSKLMDSLRSLYKECTKENRDRVKRMARAKSLIDSKECGFRELFGSCDDNCTDDDSAGRFGGAVTLPTHPGVVIEGVTSSGFYMFKSAMMPIKVPFVVRTNISIKRDQPDANSRSASPTGRGDTVATAQSASVLVPVSFPSTIVELLFKVGDDVRQDQLVVQVLGLIDTMLRQDGLDLCLSPYRVLATGPAEGLVEFVPDVVTLQSVQRDITGFIRTHNNSKEAYRAAMSRFTKSCAGYCVLTFILGIGDRHLENILLRPDGRLLHIDFGYILGNDPKPFPPPMKIIKEMVEALGGPQSDGYMEFKSYCCSSYNIIRERAPLILSMLLLMVDASIPQISGDGRVDPRVNLLKMQERLRLDLSNAEAAQYIQNVIADSVGSIFTNLWDVLHAAAQATRN
ncbi:phosphatidylinositol 3-kinase [Trypanosoma vivax]|nr:phosphatidylinositol 3-kinase [Trypanosoma vivax]